MLCPVARYFILCLILVQPSKTCPDRTEKLLTGTLRIKSNEQYTIIDFNEVDIRIYLPEKLIIHRGR